MDSSRVETTDYNLEQWCNDNGLAFNVIDLDELVNGSHTERYAFIYTGQEATKANNGYKMHWLFMDSDYIFDSYGLFRAYNIPAEFKPVELRPTRLQTFNTNVCGQYCALFYKYVSQLGADYSEDSVGKAFCANYGFTYERIDNDRKVLAEYTRLSQ